MTPRRVAAMMPAAARAPAPAAFWLFCVAELVLGAVARPVAPIFNISASSLYDAGFQHGRLAADRIQGWLASDEMTKLTAYTNSSAGRAVFERLREDNSVLFPDYVDEIRGIADGASLSVDTIWMLNLISELEGFMGFMPIDGHCSDIFAVPTGGFQEGFVIGHNEDWRGIISEYWYFIKYTAATGADFESCAGVVYPGSVVGWAPTWNAHGVFLTQNSLFPKTRATGAAAGTFAQREAVCGRSGRRGLDAIRAQLTRHEWNLGASVNLLDLRSRRMLNVEVHEDRHSTHEVLESIADESDRGANYSHFNMYKHSGLVGLDPPEPSSEHRQARVDALPAPRTRADVLGILSDATDTVHPIWRGMTIVTLLVDGSTGRMDAWCNGTAPALAASSPSYSWDLLRFFDDGGEPPEFQILV